MQEVTDGGAGLYYTFPVPQGLTEGEYEYYVTPAGGVLELVPDDIRGSRVDGEPVRILDCGVAQVGEIAREKSEYNTRKEYEQYNG